MTEKVLFEYVAGERSAKPRGRLKVKIRSGPWSGELCWPGFGVCGDPEAHARGAAKMRSGKAGFRATLDALERMYRELYGTEGSRGRPPGNQL